MWGLAVWGMWQHAHASPCASSHLDAYFSTRFIYCKTMKSYTATVSYYELCMEFLNMKLVAGLQITVGHRTMSDQIWQMSEQNQILIGHNVRPNKIYCLMKKFCFIMLKEKLLFLTKKSGRFPFVIQSTGWILTPAWLNRSSDTDADFSIIFTLANARQFYLSIGSEWPRS